MHTHTHTHTHACVMFMCMCMWSTRTRTCACICTRTYINTYKGWGNGVEAPGTSRALNKKAAAANIPAAMRRHLVRQQKFPLGSL